MITGIGFLYKDYIACIEQQKDINKYIFVWKHWDSSLSANLPIIFWTSDKETFLFFISYSSNIEMSDEDINKFKSEDCIPVELTKSDNDKLWIG